MSCSLATILDRDVVAGNLDIQAQKTNRILGEGDGSTIYVEMMIFQLSS